MVLARAGALYDSSMEVSLLSALIAIFNAGLKIAKINHQGTLDQYFVFGDGDEDLLLIPITGAYALLLAGEKLTDRENILDTMQAFLALRDEVERSLRSMGVTAELQEPPEPPAKPPVKKKKGKTGELHELLPSAPPSPEMESLLKEAARKKVKQQEMDEFWNKAAEQNAGKSTNPEVISYEEARKMGLTPDSKK